MEIIENELTCQNHQQYSVNIFAGEPANFWRFPLQELVDAGPGEVNGAVKLKWVCQSNGNRKHDLCSLS
jgi:hypothetical protein